MKHRPTLNCSAKHRHRWLVIINEPILWLRRCQTCGKVQGRYYEVMKCV